jgi:two-component system, chemotaxis family, sensor histidine kinase and response regulator WspE
MIKVNSSMLDLFAMEVETHTKKLTDALLAFDINTHDEKLIDTLTRAAQSLKGAARLVNVELAVTITRIMEECFTAAHEKKIRFQSDHHETFTLATEFLKHIGKMTAIQIEKPSAETKTQLQNILSRLESILQSKTEPSTPVTANAPVTNESIPTTFTVPGNIDAVMLDLFRTELDHNIQSLSDGLLSLGDNVSDAKLLENMMRASHSIKGAARLLGIDVVVKISHVMEDCFVAAQQSKITLNDDSIDVILKCIDMLKAIALLSSAEHSGWIEANSHQASALISALNTIKQGGTTSSIEKSTTQAPKKAPAGPEIKPAVASSQDAVVRVSAARINALMGLAGELSVSSHWIRGYSEDMRNLKKKHNELIDSIDHLRNILEDRHLTELESNLFMSMQSRAENYRESLTFQLINLDDFDRRTVSLTSRMNHEIIASRMRPFRDATQGYKRMVRDISRALNKKITLLIRGEDTQVDRDILEKIEAPINHMIRNAIDHGIELPSDRIAAGKPEQGTIILEAKHSAGQLSISVTDDGRGVDIEMLRSKVLKRNLVSKNMANKLSKSELLDFLFLPSFSTREEVTELSGRGVGLDVVHSTLQELRGKIHSNTELGNGMHIQMELPLTLSVIRCLLVTICDELYAFPLASIHNLKRINRADISVMEDKQYITLNDKNVGLIHCAQILGMTSDTDPEDIPIVIIGDWNALYGLVVDSFVGERNLALRPLHKRLGKVKDISAAALTNDGDPILIFDVDDLIQSVRTIVSDKDIIKVGKGRGNETPAKRVLVVDDSLTVREVEKKLLESRGYTVDIAIDGVDAWNTVRTGNYDLVISDVDMPRMNGIELVKLIKNDAALHKLPVMMVSYKDRAEDKQRGLDAGADYYLTKGSFHDETLIDAVKDLIGEALS